MGIFGPQTDLGIDGPGKQIVASDTSRIFFYTLVKVILSMCIGQRDWG